MIGNIAQILQQLLKEQRTDDVDDQDLKKQAGLKNLTNTCYANATFHELIRHPVYGTLTSEQAEQCKAPAVALAFIKLRDNRTTQALK